MKILIFPLKTRKCPRKPCTRRVTTLATCWHYLIAMDPSAYHFTSVLAFG
jgi:hypothetical protein